MPEFNKERAQQWISEHWEGPKECQICRSNAWVMLDNIWELRKFEGGGLVVGGGPIVPVVALMCSVCGQMVIFNAFRVKALDRAQVAEVEDEQ